MALHPIQEKNNPKYLSRLVGSSWSGLAFFLSEFTRCHLLLISSSWLWRPSGVPCMVGLSLHRGCSLCWNVFPFNVIWLTPLFPVLSFLDHTTYNNTYSTLPLGFPDSSVSKESTCNSGDLGLIPGLGRSPGEGKGYPFQYPGLENPMDCIVHGVTKSQTWLSDFHFTPAINICPFPLP